MSSQMIKVSVAKNGNHANAYVWVRSRSEFALEVLSLVEQGLVVELQPLAAPKDNAIQSCDIEKTFAHLIS